MRQKELAREETLLASAWVTNGSLQAPPRLACPQCLTHPVASNILRSRGSPERRPPMVVREWQAAMAATKGEPDRPGARTSRPAGRKLKGEERRGEVGHRSRHRLGGTSSRQERGSSPGIPTAEELGSVGLPAPPLCSAEGSGPTPAPVGMPLCVPLRVQRAPPHICPASPVGGGPSEPLLLGLCS